MSKKGLKLGVALAAGAGAAAILAKDFSGKQGDQSRQSQKRPKLQDLITAIQNAANTKKNSKGIYYTNGNYEAFARPEKAGRRR